MIRPAEETFLRLMSDSTKFSEDYRSANIDPAHQRADRAYHLILENEEEYEKRGRSRIFVPKTLTHCRKHKTTLVNAFVLSDDIVTLSYPPDPDAERFTNEVYNARLEAGGEFYGFLLSASDCHIKYGSAVGKVGWVFDTEETVREEQHPETGEMVGVRDVEVYDDRLYFDCVPFEDVAFDYRTISTDPVNASPFFRHWIHMYRSEVEANFLSGKWKRPEGTEEIDWASATTRRTMTSGVKSDRWGKMSDPSDTKFDGKQGEDAVSSYDMVWVSESYFRIGREDWTFLTLGDKYIVTEPKRTKDKFPFDKRPFRISRFDPEAFKAYSSGLPEMTKGLQAEVNAIRNQRRDNVAKALMPPTLVARNANVQLPSLRNIRPNSIVLADRIGQDAIREHTVPDITSSAYNEEGMATRDFEEVSSQSANRLGVQMGDRASATEAAIQASSSGEMEGFMIKNFVETFIKPLLQMGLEFTVAYETDEKILQRASDATGLPPAVELLVPCEVMVNAGMGSTNRELRSMRMAQVIDRSIQLASVDPEFAQAAKKVFVEWLPLMGFKNPSRLFPSMSAGAGMPAGSLAVGGGVSSPDGTPRPSGLPPDGSLPAEVAGGMVGGMTGEGMPDPALGASEMMSGMGVGKNLGGLARGMMQ